jgi:hypothetical protein
LLYATVPAPINVSPNPGKSVLPITNMPERQAVELREKRHLVIRQLGTLHADDQASLRQVLAAVLG